MSEKTKIRVQTMESALSERGIVCFFAVAQPLVDELSEIIGSLHRMCESAGFKSEEIKGWVEGGH